MQAGAGNLFTGIDMPPSIRKPYHALHEEHRLIADVVCFPGCHINHLTPRTLDIDRGSGADA